MNCKTRGVALLLPLLMVTDSLAQHIDVLVWDDGDRVGVGEYDFDNAVPSDRRVQIGRLAGPDGPFAYTSEAPGFISLPGADALPGRELLEYDFVPMTVDTGPHAGYRSTLLYWDGDGSVPEFGPTPTDAYEFSVAAIEGFAAATGSSEVEPGSGIARTDPNGEIHEHPVFFLDDNSDGSNTTVPAAGIYVVGFQLEIGNLAPSDPVYMVWATPEPSILPAGRPAAFWVTERVDTLFVESIEGDFNGDGVVDAIDYTVWRDGTGTTYEPSDRDLWAANYGTGASAMSSVSVPEPDCRLLLVFAATMIGASLRSRRVPSFGA